jgi:hypothetical protein
LTKIVPIQKWTSFTNVPKNHAKHWNFNFWLDEVIEDFKLNVLVKKRDLDEKLKIVSVQSLDVLVSDKFQNSKYLETWNKMLCSIYGKILMVNKRHAYESCGKKKFQKKVQMNP